MAIEPEVVDWWGISGQVNYDSEEIILPSCKNIPDLSQAGVSAKDIYDEQEFPVVFAQGNYYDCCSKAGEFEGVLLESINFFSSSKLRAEYSNNIYSVLKIVQGLQFIDIDTPLDYLQFCWNQLFSYAYKKQQKNEKLLLEIFGCMDKSQMGSLIPIVTLKYLSLYWSRVVSELENL